MTVKEKRERLIEICHKVPEKKCCTSACPIVESCEACSTLAPEDASASKIEAIYAHAVRLGTIKEE